MTAKKQTSAEAAAEAKFNTKIKPSDVDTATQQAAAIAKANPSLAGRPEIQQGLTVWLTTSGTVDQTSQKLRGAHALVTSLASTLQLDMAAWRRATHSIVALVNNASAGSADAITSWGFQTTARAINAPTLDAPTGLRVSYSRSLVMTVRWAAVREHVGYELQIGDGTPQGWGAPIPCVKTTYQPTGLTPGQKVAFRVAVLRSNGLSNWSDALTVTVR